MGADLAHRLVARGVDHFTQQVRQVPKGNHVDISPVWFMIAGITTFFFLALMAAINYSHNEVVATLAMVEQPGSTAIVRTPPQESDEPDAPLMEKEKIDVEQELFVIRTEPLTAHFRTIAPYLRSKAGKLANFRGLPIAIGYHVAFNVLHSTLSRWLMAGVMAQMLLMVLVAVGLARIELLWTHKVISEPSQKSWYTRILSRKDSARIVIPTIITMFATEATLFIPVATVGMLESFVRGVGYASMPMDVVIVLIAAASVVMTYLHITLPANIAYTRIQASLLPEEDTPIVPFERTFGGVIVESACTRFGGRAMSNAWKTVDWSVRRRVLAIYFKVAMVQIGLFFAWAVIILAEARLAFGSERFSANAQALRLNVLG